MSAFDDLLEQYIGAAGDSGDIRAIVRRCFFFDFDGAPVRLWQGQGRLYTEDGNSWLGTIDANGTDHLSVPTISDARDGSSKRLEFSLPYIDAVTYAAIKAADTAINGRSITCYLAIFGIGEGLRPATPIDFFARFTMQSPVFEERLESPDGATFIKSYKVTVIAKDGNSGRSRAPGGTYTDSCQRERARMLGVDPDLGCGFVAELANKTLQIP